MTLTQPNGPRPKYARYIRDGATLHRESWTGTGKRTQSAKEFPTDFWARSGAGKEINRRMEKGYVYLAPDAPPGGLLMQCTPPAAPLGYSFDLHPDGTTLVAGHTTYPDEKTSQLNLIDVATGVRTLVHTAAPTAEREYGWLHRVLFDGSNGLVYTLGGDTHHFDLKTGESRILASNGLGFTPNRALPSFDAARQRLLVFDAGRTVRVLDADGKTVLELGVGDRGECLAGTLSPSGRLLGLAFGEPGGHIEVWDVDTGQQAYDRPGPVNNIRSSMGIDPSDRFLSAPSGREGLVVWEFDGAVRRFDEQGFCWMSAYSPDGALLAVAWEAFSFLETETFTRLPGDPLETPGVERITFSADGSLVALSAGRISIYRTPSPN
jgi:hypothetical protein